MKKILLITLIVLLIPMLAYVALIFTHGGSETICHWRGELTPMDKVRGTVTLITGADRETYRFSDPARDYGAYTFTVGPKNTPVEVTISIRNDWYIVNSDFTLTRTENGSWLAEGTVHVDGHEPLSYRETFEQGEPIRIGVTCFP